MLFRLMAGFLASLLAVAPAQASELKLTIDASAARAVLDAFENPKLDMAQARQIASLPGIKG